MDPTTDDAQVVPDTLSAGIETTTEFDAPLPALRVSWIGWDSGLRGSGLRIADRIIAVNGQPVTRPRDSKQAQTALPWALGQVDECACWQRAGAKDGDALVLKVRRRVVPGEGWEELEVRGTLRLTRAYRNAQERPLFGPGGPERDGYDEGNSPNWWSWYGGAVRTWRDVLDEGWLRRVVTSDSELAQHLRDEDRVRRLGQQHPGPFAAAVLADFEAVRDRLRGRPYSLPPEALAFREAGERQANEIAAAGKAARAAFLVAHAAELIPPFPSIDPILGDRGAVTDKLVELPTVTSREWISQGPRTCFVFNQGADWYVADAEAPAMQAALAAQVRYERLVRPQVRAEYAVIGKILPAPRLVMTGGGGQFALQVEPVAVSIGDAFFVEVSPQLGQAPPFAGEAGLRARGLAPPPDDAPPRAVLEALFAALKVGDQVLWLSLFATWGLSFADNGLPLLRPDVTPALDSAWDSARRFVLERVCDVQVVWVDAPRVVVTGQEYPSAPRIEQTTLEVEHVRCLEDGSFRAFCAVGLHRVWTLQRLGGGPWRVVTQEGI